MVHVNINIIIILLLEIFVSSNLNNKNTDIPAKTIPINTLIAELILCFTTSVSFCASIFGNFKFIIIPIVADIKGNNTDAIMIKSILNKLN